MGWGGQSSGGAVSKDPVLVQRPVGIYAMGGEPLVAVNLLGWPRDKLPAGLAAEVLRGGLDVGRAAHCHVAGGHSIGDPGPKYGMAVTGTSDPAALRGLTPGSRACRSA